MAQSHMELPGLWHSPMWNYLDYGIVLCGTAWIMAQSHVELPELWHSAMWNCLNYGTVLCGTA